MYAEDNSVSSSEAKQRKLLVGAAKTLYAIGDRLYAMARFQGAPHVALSSERKDPADAESIVVLSDIVPCL